MLRFNLYQGADHPQAGYRREGVMPDDEHSWRDGSQVSREILADAYDAEGNLSVDFVAGVNAFTNTVLFLTGACQTTIGADWQERQMAFYPSAELVVIPGAGHEMLYENATDSTGAVRAYLNAPL